MCGFLVLDGDGKLVRNRQKVKKRKMSFLKGLVIFLIATLFVLFTTVGAVAYSCTGYKQPAGDPLDRFSIDCLGSGYTDIPSDMDEYLQSVATTGGVGNYPLRGGYAQGFITSTFDSNSNKEFVFLDTSDDSPFRITVLQFVSGQLVKTYETTITGDSTIDVSPNMQPALFDLDNDGKNEINFLVRDGTDSKLLSTDLILKITGIKTLSQL